MAEQSPLSVIKNILRLVGHEGDELIFLTSELWGQIAQLTSALFMNSEEFKDIEEQLQEIFTDLQTQSLKQTVEKHSDDIPAELFATHLEKATQEVLATYFSEIYDSLSEEQKTAIRTYLEEIQETEYG